MSSTEKLRDNIFNSSWSEELKASPEVRKAVNDFIDRLTEEESAGLLALEGYREKVTVDTKNVPHVINATDPDRIAYAPPEDLGVITYERDLPSIADLIIMMAASESGRELIQKKASDPAGQISNYWKQLAGLIPSEHVTRPDKYPLITTALAQSFRSLPQKETRRFTFESRQEVRQGRGKKLLITSAAGEYTGEGKISHQPLDLSVISAVAGLLEAGNPVITPAMIWRWMAGLHEGAKVTAHQEKIIREYVDRMRLTKMTIDATEEAMRYRKDVKSGSLDQNVLMLTGAKIVYVNGKKTQGWEPVFDKRGNVIMPILYVHALISGQIQSVDAEDLRIEDLSMTEKNIVLRDVILNNIHRIKSSAATSNRITYAQLYSAAKVNEDASTARVEKKRVRESALKILADLKRKGRFDDFKEYGKSKGSKDGVEILILSRIEASEEE